MTTISVYIIINYMLIMMMMLMFMGRLLTGWLLPLNYQLMQLVKKIFAPKEVPTMKVILIIMVMMTMVMMMVLIMMMMVMLTPQVDDRFVVQDFILPIDHVKKAVQFCDEVEISIITIFIHHHCHVLANTNTRQILH